MFFSIYDDIANFLKKSESHEASSTTQYETSEEVEAKTVINKKVTDLVSDSDASSGNFSKKNFEISESHF